MSFKKNHLAFVVSGLCVVGATIVYMKFNYDDTSKHETNSSIIVNTPSYGNVLVDNSSTVSSKDILVQGLDSSTLNESDISKNQSSSIIDVDNKSDREKLKLETEERIKKEKEDLVRKAAIEKELLLKQNQQLQQELAKKEASEKEAEKKKAEAEKEAVKLKKEKEELAKQKVANTSSSSKICISYGPMTIDLKNRFKNILTTNKIANNVYQDRQLPQYEIFWNLGNNKLEALEKFEKQKKEGALRDEKFKLTQDTNSNWIVPATTIAGDYSVAETLAKQLNASSSKFGGNWEIREKTGGHYIIFPNVNLVNENVLLTIDKDLRLNKIFC